MTVRCRAMALLVLLLASLLASACEVDIAGLLETKNPAPATVTPSMAVTPVDVHFEVDLPEGTPASQPVYMDILDEVTGLALNPSRHPMEPSGSLHYSATIPVMPGSLVKYRFTRGDRAENVEYNCLGQQVRYRMAYVTGPDIASDVVCRWNDLEANGERGRISGQVMAANGLQPLPNVIVAAGGVTTLTSSDGSFLLEGLPPGTHNLIAASLDGAYSPYQQGAVIAANATTPARLLLAAASPVHIKFLVSLPEGDATQLPLFMVGNLPSLGNTFADMAGGMNTVAYRADQMTREADGRYALEMDVPAGFDLRYKYTRGDGFWNAELTSHGGFRVRQLVVPAQNSVIEDAVTSWAVRDIAPVTFDVVVPENTPIDDTVSIQLSAFGWTEPIPMWRGENQHWSYTLYNPLHLMSTFQYRFCRNNVCSVADDCASIGSGANGKVVEVSSQPETIQDTVTEWAWWQGKPEPAVVDVSSQGMRNTAFLAGVEFQPNYRPTWDAVNGPLFTELGANGTSWVFLTPTWHYSLNNPPVLEPLPGKSSLWTGMLSSARQAQQQGLKVAIFPRSMHTGNDESWWLDAKRDTDWWTRWFERYTEFILYHADLAEQSGAAALVLGEPGIEPALPGGTLRDGSPSHIPDDAADRWTQLLAEVRARYSGQIIWAASYPGGLKVPEFVASVDQIYILWSAPVAKSVTPEIGEIAAEFSRRLVKDVRPLSEKFSKPILLGLAFPSVNGGVRGCLKTDDGCLPFSHLDQPAGDDANYELDLQEQADIYQAVLQVISLPDNAWVGGLVSRGYYPPAALQDKSSSIHGKPAEALLAAWMTQLAVMMNK